MKEFDAGVRRVYSLVASPIRGQDRSATMRDFLRIFCQTGVLGEQSCVPLSSAMRFLGHAYQFPEKDATDVLCMECIFPDFVDAIVCVAQLLLENGPVSTGTDGGLAQHVRDVVGHVITHSV